MPASFRSSFSRKSWPSPADFRHAVQLEGAVSAAPRGRVCRNQDGRRHAAALLCQLSQHFRIPRRHAPGIPHIANAGDCLLQPIRRLQPGSFQTQRKDGGIELWTALAPSCRRYPCAAATADASGSPAPDQSRSCAPPYPGFRWPRPRDKESEPCRRTARRSAPPGFIPATACCW